MRFTTGGTKDSAFQGAELLIDWPYGGLLARSAPLGDARCGHTSEWGDSWAAWRTASACVRPPWYLGIGRGLCGWACRVGEEGCALGQDF